MPCFYLTPKQDDFNQELQVCIAAANAYRAKLIELGLVGNYRDTMSDLTLKALWAALFVLAVLGAVFLESLPASATPADEHEVDKGAVILTDVIKDIRPKRSGGYGLIPRSVYIENQGEIIPVLLNSGPSEFRIILTVWTWEDVTTQVNGEPVKMRIYYDKVPRSSLPELHNR